MESEEPWQTLAGCMEIRNALQCPEGAENYISHFPVHQDGSCNGLQHYAALGRDAAGAYSVNLSPCEKPQDVYSCVAALVSYSTFSVLVFLTFFFLSNSFAVNFKSLKN